jgi:hypothetical protein
LNLTGYDQEAIDFYDLILVDILSLEPENYKVDLFIAPFLDSRDLGILVSRLNQLLV